MQKTEYYRVIVPGPRQNLNTFRRNDKDVLIQTLEEVEIAIAQMGVNDPEDEQFEEWEQLRNDCVVERIIKLSEKVPRLYDSPGFFELNYIDKRTQRAIVAHLHRYDHDFVMIGHSDMACANLTREDVLKIWNNTNVRGIGDKALSMIGKALGYNK